MKHNHSQSIGRQNCQDKPCVLDLLSALSHQDYHNLVCFAGGRLRAASNPPWHGSYLGTVDAADLVHEAILKLLLGETNASLGRHLRPDYRDGPHKFLAALRGIIDSDLHNLLKEARRREALRFPGDSGHQRCQLAQASGPNTQGLLSRRDLHRVLFRRLYARIQKQPALYQVVHDWEIRFLEDDRIGHSGIDRNLVHRVRELAREILHELARELPGGGHRGKDMLL